MDLKIMHENSKVLIVFSMAFLFTRFTWWVWSVDIIMGVACVLVLLGFCAELVLDVWISVKEELESRDK